MRIGINGMGRIGRLALRASLGGAHRDDDDPRRGNRLDVVHVTVCEPDLQRVGESRLHTALEASLNCEVHIHTR